MKDELMNMLKELIQAYNNAAEQMDFDYVRKIDTNKYFVGYKAATKKSILKLSEILNVAVNFTNGKIEINNCSLPRKTQKTDKQNTKNPPEKKLPGGFKTYLNGFIMPF